MIVTYGGRFLLCPVTVVELTDSSDGGTQPTMNLQHTNEVDFDSAEVERLLKILRLLEDAESGDEAVFFDESDRREISAIRRHIEKATGRGD